MAKFIIEIEVDEEEKDLYVTLSLDYNGMKIRIIPSDTSYIKKYDIEADEFLYQFGSHSNGEFDIHKHKDNFEITLCHYEKGTIDIVVPSTDLLVSSFKDCLRKWKNTYEIFN